MKGLFYIVGTVLLMLQTAVSGFCTNGIIPENNYIKQKSYIQQTRCKAVSSYVRKAKKVRIVYSLSAVDFDFEQIDRDDPGGEQKGESSQKDDLTQASFSFLIFAKTLLEYSFPSRRYNSFIKFHIPPPK